MSKLTKEECENSLSNLYCVLENHCGGCHRNNSYYCIKCNLKEDLSIMRKLIHEHFDNKLTNDEIDFLLISEEERVNTYKNYEDIWKSCVRKLEKQKEMLKDESN